MPTPQAPPPQPGPHQPKQEPHIAALDGLRALAVTAVFFAHYGAGNHSSSAALRFFAQLSSFGTYGVTLFFLLSGFLITGILWDSRDDPHWFKSFYIRRSLRIFPLYYATLLAYALLALYMGLFRTSWNTVWVLALYLQNIAPFSAKATHMTIPLWIYHYWSLAVEEHFYLLWPFLLRTARSKASALRLCGAVWIFSLVFEIAAVRFVPSLAGFDGALFINAGALALGGLLAILYRGQWDYVKPTFPWIAAAAFCIALSLAWHKGSLSFNGSWRLIFGSMSLTFFLAAVLSLSLQPGLLQRALSLSWVRWIGKISFGVYIYHVFFASLFGTIAERLVGSANNTSYLVVRMSVAAFMTLAIASLSYLWFERPLLRLKDRFAPRTASTARKLEAAYQHHSATDLDRSTV
jgi:peptidoglycan/LPS O-acetylase OafA/YrhL